MNDSLTDDQLVELIRHGRINTSKQAARRRERSKMHPERSESRPTASPEKNPSPTVESSKAEKELDPEWLKAQKQRAERNIASAREDKLRKDEMKEASKF